MMLCVEHGTFSYPGGRTILQDVNFSVQAGDLLAILGPNGAGKTTLLRCMLGFLRWQHGHCTLDGTDLHTLPPRTLWQQLAYVPQARHATVAYTVEETVLLGRSSRIGVFSQPSEQDVAVVHRVMHAVGIFALRHKKCTELSGGELQMALVARALAQEPRVLVLDEPESNLDFKNQLIILQTLSRLASEGITCIFNTHYPAHALQRAGKALLLTKDGEACFGATTDVVTEANLERAFGVKAIIGAVETDTAELASVVPLALAQAPAEGAGTSQEGASTPYASADILPEGTRASHANSALSGQAFAHAPVAPPAQAARNTQAASPATRIAAIAIIADSDAAAQHINELLHTYRASIIGRMGMPYPQAGVHIINVTLDAPQAQVRALAQQLGTLVGVSVKATFAQQAAVPYRNSTYD